MQVAKKKKRGRPRNKERTVQTWYRHSERTMDELRALVEYYNENRPHYADKVTEREVIARLIHRAKTDQEQGSLPYEVLFERAPVSVAADD